MFNIILFGPPGSGKGTQSENLIKKFGLKHVSTGELLRNEIAKQSTLGLQAKGYIDNGQLVPDDVVIGMIAETIDANADCKGFLFDGFPRTEAQAVALDDLLAKKGSSISALIALDVSEEELIKRLMNRGLTSNRSDDGDRAIIKARIAEYENKTAAVENYYAQFGKVKKVKGEGSVHDIFVALCNIIEKELLARNT